jgi:hypothetical protein
LALILEGRGGYFGCTFLANEFVCVFLFFWLSEWRFSGSESPCAGSKPQKYAFQLLGDAGCAQNTIGWDSPWHLGEPQALYYFSPLHLHPISHSTYPALNLLSINQLSMDPLSATASAIAVLQISGTIISACYNYRSLVKSARTDASRITSELNGLRTVIESLLSLLEDDAPDESSVLRSISQINGPLENCLKDLESVVSKLVLKDGWRATRATLVWPLREAEVRRVLESIDSTKSTIQLALLADQR